MGPLFPGPDGRRILHRLGNAHGKQASLTGPAVAPYAALHRLHQVLYDREAETRAFHPFPGGINAPLKGKKNPVQVFRGNADARIFHFNPKGYLLPVRQFL